MRYLTLASDYDGTLAHDGRVSDETLAALERLRKSGRKAFLVTGRELPELMEVFPQFEIFDWIVAENGALLFRPSDRCQKLLAPAPPPELIEELHRRGVPGISVGAAIIATWRPHETTVLEAIRDLGLEYHVIFNKDAVMVLPSGVTKATGLKAAVKEAGLSLHNVVGVGDAENDHAFLGLCECSVAVSNAIPALKDRVDLVTDGERGRGVSELIERMLDDDLASLDDRLTRHRLLVGTDENGAEVKVRPYGENLLVAGSSGGGKSTLTTGLIERLIERGYRVCVVDPEGDYGTLENAVVLGSPSQPPLLNEAVRLFQRSGPNAVVNLVAFHLAERPGFFLSLMSRLQELRAANGQPHWIVVDEAHHVLPAAWEHGSQHLPDKLDRVALVTLEPDSILAPVLDSVGTILAVGDAAGKTLRCFAELRHEPAPQTPHEQLASGKALFWRTHDGQPRVLDVAPSTIAHRRHVRKYAEGDLGEDRSFYFRGPDGKLRLQAQNLMLFIQMAEGIDDDTWLHHLRQHDYSKWFEEGIKDEKLAQAAREIEDDESLDASESRERIVALLSERYTAPAGGLA